MRVTKTARMAAMITVVALGLAACGGGGTEPPGLDGQTDVATSPPPTDVGEPTTTAESTPESEGEKDGDGTEPEPEFTQPYLPSDEPSVITLPDELPIEPPADMSDEEQDALQAAGRFMASWQAVLFGADEERSRVRETATGVQLDRLLEFMDEAEEEEWVFVGQPLKLRALDVTLVGNAASVDLCIAFPSWIEVKGGTVTPYLGPERYLIELTKSAGNWSAADTRSQELSACDA